MNMFKILAQENLNHEFRYPLASHKNTHNISSEKSVFIFQAFYFFCLQLVFCGTWEKAGLFSVMR